MKVHCTCISQMMITFYCYSTKRMSIFFFCCCCCIEGRVEKARKITKSKCDEIYEKQLRHYFYYVILRINTEHQIVFGLSLAVRYAYFRFHCSITIIYLCVYVYTHTCSFCVLYLCMCMYMYMYMYMCMYIYIY